MADSYIDYDEVGEYGAHFLNETQKLVGASPLVDVEHLRTRVRQAIEKVSSELTAAGISLDALRGERLDSAKEAQDVRGSLTRFFNYLGSLHPEKVTFSLGAFFPRGNLGNLSDLKPADVKAKADEVLRGFEAEANKNLPGKDEWKQEIEAERNELEAALVGKGGRTAAKIVATAGLRGAREEFLQLYQGVAKPAIRALLNELGRSKEYKLFFKDLQVQE